MRYGELPRQRNKAFADMKENIELIEKGEPVSEEVFMDAVDRFFDSTGTLEAAAEIGGADPFMDVDVLMRKIRTERSNRAINRICNGIKTGAVATGKAFAKVASSGLKLAGSACAAGAKALDKTQSQ